MLENLKPAPKLAAQASWRAGIEFDGDHGEATTPYASQPKSFEELLTEAGLNPEEYEIVGQPRISKWQQRDGGDYLTSFRFRFQRINNAGINLPLLYRNAKSRVRSPKSVQADKAFVIMLSDLQLGKTDYRGGTEETIARILTSFKALEKQLRKGYERIVIADMGDVVEGFSNSANEQQNYSNDISIMQQVDLAATLIWELVKTCRKYSDNLTYATVASNHCQFRINKQQVGKPGLDDWGVVIAQQIHRLAKETSIPLKVLVPQPHDESLAFDVFDDQFHIIGLWHGHQAGRPEQVPTWWEKQAFGSQPVAGASIGLTGHFHHLIVKELGQHQNGGSRFWIQGKTLDAGSNWWRLNSGQDSQPGLTCFELEKQKHFTGTVINL